MLTYNFPNIDLLEKKHKELMIKTIAKNIKNIRLSRELSQEEVSAIAGISSKHLQKVESAKSSPSARVVSQLSKALGVPICRILSTDNCPGIKDDMNGEIKKLFMGKEERDLKKAIKILEAFFSE